MKYEGDKESMQTLNQIKQFDKEYQNIYEEKFLNGRAGACMMCGIGVSLMLLPVGLGDFVWCILVLGGTFCAVGVELYMLGWLHIGNKLKFMPVTSAQIRKIRCRYLRRICLYLTAAAFTMQQLASLLHGSFGWKSAAFALAWGVCVWMYNWILIYMICR